MWKLLNHLFWQVSFLVYSKKTCSRLQWTACTERNELQFRSKQGNHNNRTCLPVCLTYNMWTVVSKSQSRSEHDLRVKRELNLRPHNQRGDKCCICKPIKAHTLFLLHTHWDTHTHTAPLCFYSYLAYLWSSSSCSANQETRGDEG